MRRKFYFTCTTLTCLRIHLHMALAEGLPRELSVQKNL